MPITPWISTVNKIKDGTDVSAAVVNPISTQHTQRAQHLYEKFNELSGKSVLVAYDQPILTSSISDVRKNTVVFYDKEGSNEGISPALVEFSSNNNFTSSYSPASSSYAMGIVKEVTNTRADVYLLGLVDLDVNLDDATYGLIQSDESDPGSPFIPGPLYLSRTEAGKLTKNPGGVAIYIGYAMNRRTLLLAPNVSEFNQFFTSYKFNILDRPAGTPLLDGSGWVMSGVDEVNGDGGINYTGWVPVDSLIGGPIESLIPEGAKFYYNIPSDTKIASDTGMDSDSVLRDEQIELSGALPPNPTNVTLLTVNGIIQSSRDTATDGIYIVNTAGIWWFADEDGQQPWASDIPPGAPMFFDYIDNAMLIVDGTLEVNDKVRVIAPFGGTPPTGLALNTTYYVINPIPYGSDQVIQLSATEGGDPVDFDGDEVGDIFVSSVYAWKFARGTGEYRPRMTLQFLKFNPALRESIVTSIKKYDSGSNALSFYTANKSAEASTGDLLARLNLEFDTTADPETSATAVSGLTFVGSTGLVTTDRTPVIAELIEGTGVSITPRTIGGVPKPGSYIISAATNSQSGRVSYIEPDGAELLYSGLHSYLNMPPTTTLPSSLTGKILLPYNTPDADLSLVLLLIGKTSLSLGSNNKVVSYDFSYSVTKPGAVLDPAITPTTLSFNIPNSTAAYTAKTCFKVGAVTNVPPFSIPLTSLKIPSTMFRGGDCTVNFRLTRKTPGSNAYVGDIGVVDIYWRIG
jgi:hypothetical protein